MIWVGWRQQRLETLIAAALLAVFAAVAIPVGVHMASVYAHEGLAACVGSVRPGPCNVTVASFLSRFGGINVLVTWSTLLPALAALLLAAPFLLDLDNGTYRLFWTQSITRRRWIAVKLGLAIGAAIVVAGALAALVIWSRAPLDRLDGRMSANVYDAEGVVPIAYALLALGVAVAIGALWRRTVPALLIAFLVYVVGRGFMDSWGRQRLLTPVRTTWLQGSGAAPNLNQALVIDQFVSDKQGHRLATAVRPCGSASNDGFLTHTRHLCTQAHALGAHVYMTAIYQPASRFWALQGAEFAIVAGTGCLLVLLAGWWTHHRIA